MDFSRLLKKVAVVAAPGAEMEAHPGYEKHDARGRGTGNSRNGYSQKMLKVITVKSGNWSILTEKMIGGNVAFKTKVVKQGIFRRG